jgi:hypothetical protein
MMRGASTWRRWTPGGCPGLGGTGSPGPGGTGSPGLGGTGSPGRVAGRRMIPILERDRVANATLNVVWADVHEGSVRNLRLTET